MEMQKVLALVPKMDCWMKLEMTVSLARTKAPPRCERMAQMILQSKAPVKVSLISQQKVDQICELWGMSLELEMAMSLGDVLAWQLLDAEMEYLIS